MVATGLQSLDVFVSSPGDVNEERETIRSVVEALGKQSEFSGRFAFNLLAYEHAIPAEVGKSPQALVDEYMRKANDCDIFICVLRGRMGTPVYDPTTGMEYESGTEYEFIQAYQANQANRKPFILLYRGTTIDVDDFDPEQFARVRTFFEGFHGSHPTYNGFYKRYKSTEEFEQILQEDITTVLESHFVTTDEVERPYLDWLAKTHGTLELSGVKHAGASPTIPLDTVYVALRGDRSSPFEREQSQLLLEHEISAIEDSSASRELSPEEKRALRWRHLGRSPLMPSLEQRDRPHLFSGKRQEKLSVSEVFQRERRLVILGDPGSGKTTVTRWLTLKLAQALLGGHDRLVVSASQVGALAENADSPDANAAVDLGPARLPVILRVAEFADARRKQPNLLLADFLGQQTWLGERPTFPAHHPTRAGDAIPPEQLNRLIKSYLRKGQAVIILDGLDEITSVDSRKDIVGAVETFMQAMITAPTEPAPAEAPPAERPTGDALIQLVTPGRDDEPKRRDDDPKRRGGNQILITSRISGYHDAILKGQVALFTIEPMSGDEIDRFCDNWMLAVHRLMNPDADPEAVRAAAAREAKALEAEIHNPERPGVLELASNPLLLTVIALIYQNSRSSLPEQRVRLYEMAVDNLAEVWKRREGGLDSHEILYVLSYVAAYIHENYSTGLIEETELKALITQSLARYRGVDEQRLPPRFQSDVENFLTVLREEVGLLAARGEFLYGFLHLTFQEYLAALNLVEDSAQAKERMLARLDNPRWREPLLLALGYISIHWNESARNALLHDLLEANDALSTLLPRSALLIAAALPEMQRLPSPENLRLLAENLFRTYADRNGIGRFKPLQAMIESAFANMIAAKATSVVSATVLKALQNTDEAQVGGALSAAQLVRKLRYYDNEIADALLSVVRLDDGQWDWPINNALRDIADRNPKLLPLSRLPFKAFLMRNPECVEVITGNLDWYRLVVALYGGLEAIADDENSVDSMYVFSVEHIYRDSALTESIIPLLLEQQPAGALVTQNLKAYVEKWGELTNLDPKTQVEMTEFVIALAILGGNVLPLVRELRNAFEGSQIIRLLLARLNYLTEQLRPVIRSASKEVIAELRNSPLSQQPEWIQFLTGLQNLEMRYGEGAASPLDLIGKESTETASQVMAVYWALLFSQRNDDSVYSIAVTLDTAGPGLAKDPYTLARSFALAQHIQRNYRLWNPEPYLTPMNERTDVLAEALNAIATMDPSISHCLSWALEELSPLLRDRPDLIPEAQAIALASTSVEFLRNALQSIQPGIWDETGGEGQLTQRLYQETMTLTDPLVRARTLWRLAPYLAYISVRQYLRTTASAIESALAVEDASERSRMLCRLVALIPVASERAVVLTHALESAQAIGDPVEHAYALARLTPYFTGAARDDTLAQLAASIASIEDEQSQNDAREAMRGLLVRFDAVDDLDDSAEHAAQPTQQDAFVELLLQNRRAMRFVGAWAPIMTLAVIDQLRARLDVPEDTQERWLTLADPVRQSAVIDALLREGAAQSLPLTAIATATLDALLRQGNVETVERLLAITHHPDSLALPTIQSWLSHPNVAIQQHAALLLAEGSILTKDTIEHMLALLESSDDRLRHRAQMGMYNKTLGFSGDPRFRLSRIGREVIDLIASRLASTNSMTVGAQQTIAWFWENLIYDDGEVIEQWVKELEGADRELAALAATKLLSISNLSSEAWDSFLAALGTATPLTKQYLFQAVEGVIGKRYRMTKDIWSRLRQVIHRLCLEGDLDTRLAALRVLGAMPFADQSDPALLDSIIQSDASDPLIETAVVAYGAVNQQPEGVDHLVALLKSSRRAHVNGAAEALARKTIRSLSYGADEKDVTQRLDALIDLIGDDPEFLFTTLLRANSDRWFREEDRRAVEMLAALVERYPQFLPRLIQQVVEIIERPDPNRYELKARIQSKVSLYDEIVNFDALAEVTPEMQSAFANAIEPTKMQRLLIQFVRDKRGSFMERRSCIVLLSYLRHVTPEIVSAFHAALYDNYYVQTSAIEAASYFRQIDDELLPPLAKGLYDESAMGAYLTARLLTALGLSSYASTKARPQIMAMLAEALQNVAVARDVYVLKSDIRQIPDGQGGHYVENYGLIIQHEGRLDELLYQALMQVSGASNLVKTKQIAGLDSRRTIVDEAGAGVLVVKTQ